MARYLLSSHIDSAISRGKSVEQFLGFISQGAISWIELRPRKDQIEVWRFMVEDVGSEAHIDLYTFPPIEGDWPEYPESAHSSLDEALAHCRTHFGSDDGRWVNQFVIQDEYVDAKK